MGNQEDLKHAEDNVAASAEACLEKSPSLAECNISCRFHEGTLTLRGRVPTHSLKYSAQTLVERIDGVRNVHNRLEVMPFPASCEADGNGFELPPDAEKGAG